MKTTMRAALALGAALALTGLAACDRESHTTGTNASTSPEASTQVIGVKPAEPSGDPAGTTPVDGPQSDVRKKDQSEKMPLEGQPNSHSSVSPDASQKAGAEQSTRGATSQ
jgi:hypothetical protein